MIQHVTSNTQLCIIVGHGTFIQAHVSTRLTLTPITLKVVYVLMIPILHLANLPQLVWREVLLRPQRVVVPSSMKHVQACLKTWQKNVMETEEVCDVAYVKETLLLQQLKKVVKDIGYTHPNIPPKSLDSVENKIHQTT